MKKLLAIVLTACMLLALTACGASNAAEAPKADAPADSAKVYKIGICQLVQHEALDAATQGFMDKLTELLGEGNVEFDLQNASGDTATCGTIANAFVADEVDLSHVYLAYTEESLRQSLMKLERPRTSKGKARPKTGRR